MPQDILNEESDAVEAVFTALARAEDRLSRLDERVQRSGFAEGWRSRLEVRATVAAMALMGHLVHPEDLLLHDLGTDIRVPEPEVAQARGLLVARRRAATHGAELLSWAGTAWLAGLTKLSPPPGPRASAAVDRGVAGYSRLLAYFSSLGRGVTEAPRVAAEEVLAVLDVGALPPLLLAVGLMEAWRVADPLPARRDLGPILAGVWLKTAGRFNAGLFPIEVALRRRPMPPRLAWAPLHERLVFHLDAVVLAVDLELEELTRLGHQKALAERRLAAGRKHSKAPSLLRLAIENAVLTPELVARELGVTPQGSLLLLRKLEGILHEITGRSRYRVWRL